MSDKIEVIRKQLNDFEKKLEEKDYKSDEGKNILITKINYLARTIDQLEKFENELGKTIKLSYEELYLTLSLLAKERSIYDKTMEKEKSIRLDTLLDTVISKFEEAISDCLKIEII